MKRWFSVSKEVKVGVSGKIKFSDGLPHYTDPAVELKHKYGTQHGSSVIITARSLALAHMRRFTGARNVWLSGLLNFSFAKETLTPQQLSLCVRFHPEGSELLEKTIALVSFDTPKIGERGDIFSNGFLTLSALTHLRKDLIGGLQLTHSTHLVSQTARSNPFHTLEVNPLLQAGLQFKRDNFTVTASALVDPKHLKDKSDLKLSVEHYFDQFSVNGIVSATYAPRNHSVKWSAGAYVMLADIVPL